MSDDESDKHILDLSRKQLKKVPKQDDAQNVRKLILDENELQKIDNIDSYLKIETLSLSKNQLLRMYGVCRLHCLRELILSFNGILSIEGLKDCVHLRLLNLEGNNIKTIEHLNNNTQLEYLNLAENSIGSISDISFLKNLKELNLHGNRLTHLRQCDKHLPMSLEVLTLGKNNICDLNEICTLSHLCNLQSFSISDNPCVTMTVGQNGLDGFDYRPFVLNWCMSVKVIDGFMVDPIESLKAEWLYSQGRGRQFRIGEQSALAKYLSSVCPLIGKALENENERKLRLILSKAQHHQRQLQEEILEHGSSSTNNSPSSGRKKPTSRIQSPRFSRLSGRQSSPESMISSYHGNTSNEQSLNSINNHTLHMSTSLIENIKNDSIVSDSYSLASSNVTTKTNNSQESTPRNITPNPYNDQSYISQQPPTGGPLAAASKMVPVPETLMSPDVCPAVVAQRMNVSALHTPIQNLKMHKNKDNKLNSPRMRSPQLKRTSERSPTTSPRKNSSAHSQQQKPNKSAMSNQAATTQIVDRDVQLTRHFISNNSVLVSATDSCEFSSDDDSDQMNNDKLKTIRNKAAQRSQQQNNSNNTESSAVVIQKIWRGYRTRKRTKDIAEKLHKQRTLEYIDQLTKDMQRTKAQLENDHKLQHLQMQAISALHKKVQEMEPIVRQKASANADEQTVCNNSSSEPLSLDNNSASVVHDLAKSCSMLTNQVQQLQCSMRDIVNCLTLVCNLPQETVKKLINAGSSLNSENTNDVDQLRNTATATQTEIIAVHTPQMEEHFPYGTRLRPSTLLLEKNQSLNEMAASSTNIGHEELSIVSVKSIEDDEHSSDVKHSSRADAKGMTGDQSAVEVEESDRSIESIN